jgi:hypothetical protein
MNRKAILSALRPSPFAPEAAARATLSIPPLRNPPEIDLENRILRNVVICTCALATDGMIFLPDRMETETFLRAGGPVVSRHTQAGPGQPVLSPDGKPIVIAAARGLLATETELTVTELQFADTELGRDFAYLYGVNPKREVFARSWSIEAPIVERMTATWEQARIISGQYWDQIIADRLMPKMTAVPVVTKSQLNTFAAVPVGADKHALTRASLDGNQAANLLLTNLNLQEAGEYLAAIRKENADMRERVARLETELKALRGEVASAAAQSNSDAVLQELQAMLSAARRQ